jgi:hypothetical protein
MARAAAKPSSLKGLALPVLALGVQSGVPSGWAASVVSAVFAAIVMVGLRLVYVNVVGSNLVDCSCKRL